MMIKVFAKKLFGIKYEKIMRNIVISLVLFFGIYNTNIQVKIAPSVLMFMVTVITAGDLWRALASDDMAENMKQLFMLPMENRSFVGSYVAILSAFVFLTRTLPVLALVFAVSGVTASKVISVLLCVVSASALAAGIFVWQKKGIPAVLALLGMIAAIFFVKAESILWIVFAVIGIGAMICLSMTDAYGFYREEGKKKSTIQGRNKASVLVYIFRYMFAHKNYLINTVFMWGVACILPMFFSQVTEVDPELVKMVIPIGFAILSLNTPISILVSSSHSLEEAIRFLPDQKRSFFAPYCGFIFGCNIVANMIYLASVQLQMGGVSMYLILAAVFFALQSAIISVLLEYFYPIHGWKIENELWHHPRKYVVPVIMVVLAGVVGALPVASVALLAFVAVEGVFLLGTGDGSLSQ